MIPGRRPAACVSLSVSFPIDAFVSRSGNDRIEPEVFAILQHRPRQPGVLGGNRHHRAPVAAALDQTARPATEAILLVAQTAENGASAHHEKTAQIGITRLGDAPESRLAAAAVLTRRQTDPRRDLSAVVEFLSLIHI